MKLLLYCTKAKPYLVKRNIFAGVEPSYFTLKENVEDKLNGKIVAECDFEVEVINYKFYDFNERCYETSSMDDETLCKKSCLSDEELSDYLPLRQLCFNQDKVGYAIHIKNLHIFDKPRELSKGYYLTLEKGFLRQIKKAPQNMCYAFTTREDKDILISIKPEWLCKILNGEKTIEIRKKVLKEMLK